MPKIQKDKELKALQDFDSLLIGENQYLDPSPEGDFLTEETKELKILYNNIIKAMGKTDSTFDSIIDRRVSQGSITTQAAKDLKKVYAIQTTQDSIPDATIPAPRDNFYGIEQPTFKDFSDSKPKRKTKAEGGELYEQMEGMMEEPTHTMPDGTEMAGATHGEYEEQMEGLMDKETPMLPDEEMEEDYVNYVIEETLPSQDKDYLISALEKDDRLSEIFDQVVESATEFSGSGPIEGPGSEMSDSIPARLSDGEFVFTAKAVEEIGVDTLTSMMKDAEAEAEKRQGAAYGGMIEDESDPKAVPIQTTGLLTAQGNIPNVVKPNRQVEEEMLKASPRRYYVPLSG